MALDLEPRMEPPTDDHRYDSHCSMSLEDQGHACCWHQRNAVPCSPKPDQVACNLVLEMVGIVGIPSNQTGCRHLEDQDTHADLELFVA